MKRTFVAFAGLAIQTTKGTTIHATLSHERDVQGAGRLAPEQLRDIAHRSNCAIEHLPGYVWEQSYVAGDRFYCVHSAPNEEAVREHARRGGFPVTRITPISAVMTPATAGTAAAATS